MPGEQEMGVGDMKRFLFGTTVVLFAATSAMAGGQGNDVTQGNNHGAAASSTAQDLGGVGGAIGGKGNSDGNPDNGQAHDENGTRGEQVQSFLGGIGIGSN
jgi:hypothetical protein